MKKKIRSISQCEKKLWRVEVDGIQEIVGWGYLLVHISENMCIL